MLLLALLFLAAAATVCRCREIERDRAFVGFRERSVSPQGQGADIREALQDELADAERSADDRELMPNPLCVDSDIACDDWQRKGECERNAAFMRQTCGLSCGFCKSRIERSALQGRNVDLVTEHGRIKVQLLWDKAPETCRLIAELASRKEEVGSRFYRNEAVPESGAGPPYALLQGTMSQLEVAPPKEGTTDIRRGHIASIHPERDFYIALAPHADWSNAHTAWGFIEDLSAVEAVVAHAFTEMKHAVHGTVMRMLVEPVPFTVELAADDEAPARRA